MATRTTQYQITGDASRFASAMDEASKATEQMEGSLSALRSNIETATQGTLEFDDAVNRYRDSAGRFVSAADAQEAAMSALREEGVRTEDQIQEQIQRLEALREVKGDDAVATQELTERISSLRGELQQAEAAVRQSEQAARNLQQGFGSGVEATTDFAQRQDMLQQELLSTAAAQERVASSGVTMRSSVGASANNLGFEMVQAAQDARFGLAGVANQIPLMSEQFTQLQAKTGSTSAALSSLAGSFLGTTGIIAAITLGLQWLPDLISSTDEAGSSAEEASEDFDAASRSIMGFTDAANRSNTMLSNMDSIIESINQRAQRLGRSTLPEALETLQSPTGRAVSPTGGPTAARTSFQQEQALERVRGLLRQSTGEVRIFRSSLRALGVDVDEILRGNLEAAREEVTENIRRFQDLGRTIQQAVGEDIGVVTQDIMTRFDRMGARVSTEVDRGLIDPVDAAERRVSFLESALQSLSESGVDITQEEFDPLFAALEEWRQRLEDLEEQGEGTKEAMKPPEVDFVTDRRLERLRSLNEIFQETMLLRQQASRAALRNLPAAGQGPAPGGAGGGVFDQLASQLGRALSAQELGFDKIGQQIGKKILKSARQALIRGDITKEEFEGLKDALEAAGFTVENDINFGLEQSIRLASQLGTTMIQAAQQGGVAWNQLLGSILTTIGSVVGEANPVVGAALAGSGQILGAIDTGGSNDRRAAASQAQASRAARSTTAGVEAQLAETNVRLQRVEAAIAMREVAVPVRETKHAIVEDDIAEGQSTGNPLVANVENL